MTEQFIVKEPPKSGFLALDVAVTKAILQHALIPIGDEQAVLKARILELSVTTVMKHIYMLYILVSIYSLFQVNFLYQFLLCAAKKNTFCIEGNPCYGNPCNIGNCTEQNNTYSCDCSETYFGRRCERRKCHMK